MYSLGRLTFQPLPFRVLPDPQNPGQLQVQVALGAAAQILAGQGVILNASIGVDSFTADALRAQSQQIPNPVTISAMVDTGASQLGLDRSIIASLNLNRRGVTTCDTAAGRRLANIYTVSLSFPGTQLRAYNLLRAIDVDLSNQPFKCLIGRETMANWHLHYNGQSGAISIAD